MPDLLNYHRERSRLDPQQLARWHGLPVCWLDASPQTFTRHLMAQSPVLAMIDSGAAEADIDFGSRSVHLSVDEGTIGLFAPGASRSSRWRCDAVRRIMLQVDFPWLVRRGLAEDDWQTLQLRQDVAFRDEKLSALMRAMVHEVARGSPNGTAYAETLSVDLAARVVEVHGEHKQSIRERGRLTAAQLRRLDALIDSQLEGTISLALLSETIGLSAPHFTRLFRRTVGRSPHQHVLQRRVQRACALIEGTDLPLAGISAAAGFSTQSHMTAVFVKVFGVTPGNWRHGDNRVDAEEPS